MEKNSGGTSAVNTPIDLVTGATSRLGSLVAKKLIGLGHDVRVIVRRDPSSSEEWKHLSPGVKPYIADLTLKKASDEEVLKRACAGVNNIFHTASAVFNYKHTYDEFIETNVVGTENLINAALAANSGKAMRFICAGSVSVYGYRRPNEVLDEESETHPESNYSKSKLMQEEVIKAYSEANRELRYTILRYSTLYGPGYEESFFKIFKLLEEGKLRYIGDGNNHLALLHVNDAAEAMVAVSESSKSINEIYNVSDGATHTVRSLYEFAAKLLNVPPPKRRVSGTMARIGSRFAGLKYDEFEFVTSDRIINISKLIKDIGFRPRISIEEGGGELIGEFLKTHHSVI
ncbi:MAG: NAD(P)-dependent oxidoreductase [Candidatus Micrarchaeaceae archaeon]